MERSFAKESVALNGTDYQRQYLVGGKSYLGPYKQPNANFKGVTTEGNDTLVFHLVDQGCRRSTTSRRSRNSPRPARPRTPRVTTRSTR